MKNKKYFRKKYKRLHGIKVNLPISTWWIPPIRKKTGANSSSTPKTSSRTLYIIIHGINATSFLSESFEIITPAVLCAFQWPLGSLSPLYLRRSTKAGFNASNIAKPDGFFLNSSPFCLGNSSGWKTFWFRLNISEMFSQNGRMVSCASE